MPLPSPTLTSLAAAVLAAALPWTLLWLAAWLAARNPHRLPASGRHLIWASALAGLVLLPFAQRVMPRWDLFQLRPTLTTTSQSPTELALISAGVSPAPAVELDMVPASAEFETVKTGPTAASAAKIDPMATATTAVPTWSIVTWTLLTWIWSTVTATLLAFWFLGHLTARKLATNAGPGTTPALLDAADQAARDTGLPRSFSLLVSQRRMVPMTWGFLRPTVLIPGDWPTWTDARLRTVLLHELAHIQRYDAFSLALARLACALFWFHPAVWHAAARLRAEAENACDDAVVRAGLPATDYAEHLLALARGFNENARSALAAVSIGMARPGGLENRLRALFDERRPRVVSSRLQAGLWLVALGTTLALAGLTAVPPNSATPSYPSSHSEAQTEYWLRSVSTAESDETSWTMECPGGESGQDSLCADTARKALALLRKSAKTGTIVIQDVATGQITAYASTTDDQTPVPLVAPASLAKLALASLWWETGLGDEKRDCPRQWRLSDGRRVRNYRQQDQGLITVPHEMIVQSCNTAAASMSQDLLERLGANQVHQRYADFGFASPPTKGNSQSAAGAPFWETSALFRTAPPHPSLGDSEREQQDWTLLAAGLGSIRTTPLHISRFLQGIGNNGVVIEPRPASDWTDHPAEQTPLLSRETATRLRLAMDHVVSEGTGQRITPQLEWSDWRLGGKTGSAPGRGANADGWFAGLAYGAGGHARYTVVVWIEDGGPGGGQPAGIAAEMTRFLARADGGEL